MSDFKVAFIPGNTRRVPGTDNEIPEPTFLRPEPDRNRQFGTRYNTNKEKQRIFNILLPNFFTDCIPESIFSSRVEHQVDIQRKLQEDPLIALKQTEVDKRKRILDNPLKMREIQTYVSNIFKLKDERTFLTVIFFFRLRK